MRAYVLILLSAGLCGCGDVSSNTDMTTNVDMAMAGGTTDMATGGTDGGGSASLLVNNTISWCTVIVTIGNGAPTTFGGSSMTFTAAPGTTINLKADPKPGFFAVKWTGVTTMSGDMATYVMTAAASQTVTACCPTTAAGGGC